MIRLELLTPAGDVMTADTYNKMFTMHGVVMVFFFLIPSIPAVLGNFLIPIMIGAKDLAFPRINLLSWYIYVLGGIFTLVAALSGGVDTGWTFYTPYSTAAANSHVITAALGVFITGFSSILTGLNFIVTIHRMRAPGLTWFRLPLFVWAHYATSLIMILGTPVIAITVLLVAAERALHMGIFDPALGGDPILFQHLFWFYSHPAVYIMILPAMGVISEIIQAFSRKNIFGYSFVAFSSLAIAIIGFLVWGHHIFVAGQSVYAGLHLLDPELRRRHPVGHQGLQLDGDDLQGIGQPRLADALCVRIPRPLHDRRPDGTLPRRRWVSTSTCTTRISWSRTSTTSWSAAPSWGTSAGCTTGGRRSAAACTRKGGPSSRRCMVFVGFNLTFFPQFVAGYLGMPRRYHAYPDEFQVLNVASTLGASVLSVGYVLPMVYFTWSIFAGEKSPADPWGAKGLEWETPSPPPTENFHVTPIVTHGTHQYAPSKEVGIV